ncbi:MAG: hypothetical protein OER21_09605 [Gemmatimonadota bacterium]|nr:hypothetical protein [Gemmatimonadota bacterium]
MRRLLLIGLALLAACALERLALGPVTGDPAAIPLTVVDELASVAGPRDPVTLQNALVLGDTLRLEVSYGGGCRTHAFGLLVQRTFLETNPVQAPTALAHDDRDDPCDALVSRTLLVDLRPLREEYRRAYGAATGTLVLRFTSALLVAYTF